VPTLPAGGSFLAETVFEALDSVDQVAAAKEEIRKLQETGGSPQVHPRPTPPYAPAQ
jgi:hypothetical protein